MSPYFAVHLLTRMVLAVARTSLLNRSELLPLISGGERN